MLVIVHVSAYGFHGDEAARIVDCVVGFTAFPSAEVIPLRRRLQGCAPGSHSESRDSQRQDLTVQVSNGNHYAERKEVQPCKWKSAVNWSYSCS